MKPLGMDYSEHVQLPGIKTVLQTGCGMLLWALHVMDADVAC